MPTPDPKAKDLFAPRQASERVENSPPLHTVALTKTNHPSSQIASQGKVKRHAGSIFRRGREHCNSMKAKRCACGNCQECMKDFTYFLRLFSEDQSVPDISAKSWCIWKKKGNRYSYYYGKRIHKVREIASLSKMVTAMTAMDFLNNNHLDPGLISFAVRKTSTIVGGTTAHLQ